MLTGSFGPSVRQLSRALSFLPHDLLLLSVTLHRKHVRWLRVEKWKKREKFSAYHSIFGVPTWWRRRFFGSWVSFWSSFFFFSSEAYRLEFGFGRMRCLNTPLPSIWAVYSGLCGSTSAIRSCLFEKQIQTIQLKTCELFDKDCLRSFIRGTRVGVSTMQRVMIRRATDWAYTQSVFFLFAIRLLFSKFSFKTYSYLFIV